MQLVLLAHGSISRLDEVAAFVCEIRGGAPVAPHIVQAVQKRYEAIGGASPLVGLVRSLAERVQLATGHRCCAAMRYSEPRLVEVLRACLSSHHANAYNQPDARDVIVVPIAPYRLEPYAVAVEKALAELRTWCSNPSLAAVEMPASMPIVRTSPCMSHQPEYIDAWVCNTAACLERLGVRKTSRAVLIVTAHSLPMDQVADGAYSLRVMRAVDKLLTGLGESALPSLVAFQSQGASPQPWLGPSVATALERAKRTGAEGVVIVPLGFPIDHAETLYDLDIDAKQMAEALGLWFERVPCLNDSDEMLRIIVALIKRTLQSSPEA